VQTTFAQYLPQADVKHHSHMTLLSSPARH
jgi:hypothetical protein